MNDNTIIRTVPAAEALHKVPGFDPMKYLKRVTGPNGSSVLRLEPNYQRLWFRLACPNGRLLLTPLRVTDQLAIFEAKVFLSRDDPIPAGSFTANKSVRDTKDYIRAAQEEALKEALDSAGFGIQLCDVTRQSTVTDASPSPAPPASADNTPPVKAEKPSATVEPVAPKAEPAVSRDTAPATSVPAPVEVLENGAPQSTPDEPPREAVASEERSSLLSMLKSPQTAEKAVEPEAPANPPAAVEPAAEREEPAYTDDTPVEQILQRMTMEEAGNVMVQKGTCKGMRMEEIARRRPSSLHFFLTQFCDCGNIQKAAAHLLIQDMELKKAG